MRPLCWARAPELVRRRSASASSAAATERKAAQRKPAPRPRSFDVHNRSTTQQQQPHQQQHALESIEEHSSLSRAPQSENLNDEQDSFDAPATQIGTPTDDQGPLFTEAHPLAHGQEGADKTQKRKRKRTARALAHSTGGGADQAATAVARCFSISLSCARAPLLRGAAAPSS